MKLQGRNLAIQLRGEDVRLLHTELTRLGFTISDAESRDSLFGSATDEIVKRF